MAEGGRDPALDEAMGALGDATRRAVVGLLARGPLRAGELAAALDTTPPALSRHLRILRRSRIVDIDDVDHDARVRLYRLRLEALAPLHDWLEELRGFWSDQLDAFKAHAEAGEPAPTPVRTGRR